MARRLSSDGASCTGQSSRAWPAAGSPHSEDSDAFGSPACSSRMPVWKRAVDLAICLAVFPLLIPLVLLMAVIAWRWAPGPILFRQERVGLGGRIFTMFKFRTMKVNSDTAEHRQHIQAMIRAGKPLEKLDGRGDSRLIPFGRILRATGLDELPQIINIFRGDMSVVGPRPCVQYEADLYTPEQRERFNAVPGITGLWQVSGKNSLTLEQMIELDIRYSRTLSLGNDLAIMLRTVPTILALVRDAVVRRSGQANPPRKPAKVAAASVPAASPASRDAHRQLIQFRVPSVADHHDGRLGSARPVTNNVA